LLDTDPDLAPWAWYSSAYHQYHSVINPLVQVCLDARIPNTDRFMAVLDHVFGPTSVLSAPRHRAVTILRAIADSMSSFLAMTRNAALIPRSITATRNVPENEAFAAGFDFGNVQSDWGTAAEAVPQLRRPTQDGPPFVGHFLGTLFSETDESGNWLQFPPHAAEWDGMPDQDLDGHDG